MGNYRNERLRNRKGFILRVALGAVVMIFALNVSSSAGSSQEKSFTARKETVEKARIAFEKAKSAGAEKSAPHEYYLAEEYLHLAKEELSEGDRIGVERFAEESEIYSLRAMEKAKGGSR